MLLLSLDGVGREAPGVDGPAVQQLASLVDRLRGKNAAIDATLSVFAEIYPLIEALSVSDLRAADLVDYRRGLDLKAAMLSLPLLELELEENPRA